MHASEFPDEVYAVVKEEVERFGNEIDKAVEASEQRIRKLSCYPDIVEALVHKAVRGLVYQWRHVNNTRIRREAGIYGQPPKVRVLDSEHVQETYRNLYEIYVGGMRLGSVMGEDLEDLAEKEELIGDGHYEKARLLRELSHIVPKGRTVESAVSLKKLYAIYQKVKKRRGDSAA